MISVYQFKEELENFEQLEIEENVPLFELLNSNKILLFVDKKNSKVWTWEGANTNPRMKFISAQAAPHIRDTHDTTFTLTSVDEGEETAAFKILIGLI
ncbi:MAG: hypothetical protein ACFE9N_13470 [Promethearchaeota archaeon]